MDDEDYREDFVKLRKSKDGDYGWEISINGNVNNCVQEVIEINKKLLEKYTK